MIRELSMMNLKVRFDNTKVIIKCEGYYGKNIISVTKNYTYPKKNLGYVRGCFIFNHTIDLM